MEWNLLGCQRNSKSCPPFVYEPKDATWMADNFGKFWQKDGAICLLANEGCENPIEALTELTKFTAPPNDEYESPDTPSFFVYYWPSVLSVLLENDSDFAEKFFQITDAVMVEATEPGNWKIFAKNGFQGLLERIGLVEITDETSNDGVE